MLKRTVFLAVCCLAFLPPAGGYAQTEGGSGPSVAVMPFRGGALSGEFQNAVAGRLPELSPAYTPRPLDAGDFPAGLDLPPDEPPDPSYLGDAPYVLTGEYYDDEEGERHLQLWLWNAADGSLVSTDELIAEDMAEAETYLPSLVNWIFSRIPAEEAAAEEDPEAAEGPAADPDLAVGTDGKGGAAAVTEGPPADDPLNRRLYLGLRAGVSAGPYSLTGGGGYASAAQDYAYEAAFLAAWRPLAWLSVQAEAVFAMDAFTLRSAKTAGAAYLAYTDRMRAMSLMVPLLVKFPLRHNSLLFSPYAGACYILPLGDMTRETNNPEGAGGGAPWTMSPPLGVVAGLELGFRLGGGLAFTDLRYNAGLGSAKMDGDPLAYTRSRFTLSLGYQFALFGRK
ncbi:MAG: hypothetical protein LBQ55_05660 [Treponema sp.]|jgi:hypothetical protein|nr:hypothetical protein [Treponema sp.]